MTEGLSVLKALGYGIIIFLTILIGAVLAGDFRMAQSFSMGLGLVCLILSGTFSLAFINDQSVDRTENMEPHLIKKKENQVDDSNIIIRCPEYARIVSPLLFSLSIVGSIKRPTERL